MSRTLQGIFFAGLIAVATGLVSGIIHQDVWVGLLVGLGCGGLCMPGTLALCKETK